MIKIENYEVLGWEHAIRGMRNPMNSWDKSDSSFKATAKTICMEDGQLKDYYVRYDALGIGENDHELMMKLRNAGTDHRKFMRMIDVYVDITAPLYWWKEFDTYKVGTVANSCSTMHKIHDKKFTLDDFSCEHLITGFEEPVTECSICLIPESESCYCDYDLDCHPKDILCYTVKMLNKCREKFLETKDKKYWWQMIQLLPSSYNQKRTVMLNYEVLANIYKSRKNHKLDEWRDFCKWIESLPYSELITGGKEE